MALPGPFSPATPQGPAPPTPTWCGPSSGTPKGPPPGSPTFTRGGPSSGTPRGPLPGSRSGRPNHPHRATTGLTHLADGRSRGGSHRPRFLGHDFADDEQGGRHFHDDIDGLDANWRGGGHCGEVAARLEGSYVCKGNAAECDFAPVEERGLNGRRLGHVTASSGISDCHRRLIIRSHSRANRFALT